MPKACAGASCAGLNNTSEWHCWTGTIRLKFWEDTKSRDCGRRCPHLESVWVVELFFLQSRSQIIARHFHPLSQSKCTPTPHCNTSSHQKTSPRTSTALLPTNLCSSLKSNNSDPVAVQPFGIQTLKCSTCCDSQLVVRIRGNFQFFFLCCFSEPLQRPLYLAFLTHRQAQARADVFRDWMLWPNSTSEYAYSSLLSKQRSLQNQNYKYAANSSIQEICSAGKLRARSTHFQPLP